MTVPQSVTGVLRAVVSTKVNEDERGSRKVRLLAEPARSIRAVRMLMSASDDATRATLVGGVTSAILSASLVTSSNATCAYMAIMA